MLDWRAQSYSHQDCSVALAIINSGSVQPGLQHLHPPRRTDRQQQVNRISSAGTETATASEFLSSLETRSLFGRPGGAHTTSASSCVALLSFHSSFIIARGSLSCAVRCTRGLRTSSWEGWRGGGALCVALCLSVA